MYDLLYIDPGSGSYLIQAVVAAVLGAFFWVRMFWQRLRPKQAVVFYAENRHYYQYFERLIKDLLDKKTRILYITSDKGDPLRKNAPGGMQVMYAKWTLGLLFKKIRADVMIMTMPDLGNYLFKRSPTVNKYVYVFHATVSTHQQYRKEAFFNYDTIFCTGEFQQKEIRRAEELYRQKEKKLLSYGYPLLEEIERHTEVSPRQVILVAPSWFEGCIFDTCIEELLLQLAKSPYEVVFRFHPEYKKRNKKRFTAISQLLSQHPRMMMDEEPDVIKTLSLADILITDRSGIAFEFAWGAGKPVLFIDTALKQSNPHCRELGIEPLENSLRSDLGISITPGQLNLVPQKLDELEQLSVGFRVKSTLLKKKYLFNSEETYRQGADYIIQLTGKPSH